MEINNIDANNNIDNNTETYYYFQQFKRKIFQHIPGKIRKNAYTLIYLLITLNLIM
jgi:hypothetical protein